MEKRDYIIILYDFYCELFTDKQKKYFQDYYFNNLSLGEISDNINISRNAIHKVLKNMEDKLLFYEERLKLYEKSIMFKNIIKKIDNKVLKNELERLI